MTSHLSSENFLMVGWRLCVFWLPFSEFSAPVRSLKYRYELSHAKKQLFWIITSQLLTSFIPTIFYIHFMICIPMQDLGPCKCLHGQSHFVRGLGRCDLIYYWLPGTGIQREQWTSSSPVTPRVYGVTGKQIIYIITRTSTLYKQVLSIWSRKYRFLWEQILYYVGVRKLPI